MANPNFGKEENFRVRGLTEIRAGDPAGKSIAQTGDGVTRRYHVCFAHKATAVVQQCNVSRRAQWTCNIQYPQMTEELVSDK